MKITLMEHFVRRAYENDKVLASWFLRKIPKKIESKNEQSLSQSTQDFIIAILNRKKRSSGKPRNR